MTTTVMRKNAERGSACGERSCDSVTLRPPVDIVEREDEVTVSVDVPGACTDEIDIQFESGTLSIHAAVGARQTKGHTSVLNEYEVGDFHRTFQLSEAIDSARIAAECENGVLILHLPKTAAATRRRVPVEPANA